jgi:hypothetical protein
MMRAVPADDSMGRSSRGRASLALIAAVVMLLGACSEKSPQATSQIASEQAGAQAPRGETGSELKESSEVVADDSGAQAQAGVEAGDDEQFDATELAKGEGGLRPLDLPFKTPLPIEARLDDPCVKRGGRLLLLVKAPPEAAIAFQAVYSDGRAGTEEPMGAGYGGNGKGYSPATGEWTDTWLVSLDAPVGRGRVDVIVGHEGEWGYDDPHFAVADSNGHCPANWLKERKKDA